MMRHKKQNLAYIVLASALGLVLSGCAMQSTPVKQGTDLYKTGQYDKAIVHLKEAIEKHPDNSELRTMLLRARISSYYHHLGSARKHRQGGRKDEAVKEYQTALAIFPDNLRLQEELKIYIYGEKPEPAETFTSDITPPYVLTVNPQETISLNLRSVPISKIFKMLGKSFKINCIFDKDFRDFLYAVEIEDTGFFEIMNQLCMVANSRYRILDSRSVLIYPNTPIKKRSFDLKGVKVFYLKHSLAEDAKGLIMSMFRDQQIMAQEDIHLNALIVKASQDTLVEIEKFLAKIDKEKDEVQLDVEILEINRNLLNQIGVDYSSSPLKFNAGIPDDETGEVNSIIPGSQLGAAQIFVTVPTVALHFLEADDDSKIIAKPNLRGVDGEEIKFIVGEELPIPQTQWQAIAAGGVANSPVTSYQYQNVGVTVKLVPHIHGNDEVTIKVKFTIRFVINYVDNFPILGKRELENIIRLKGGETNIIGGFLREEDRNSLAGMPALSRIPILGRLFGASEKTIQQTDVIFSITPRIIRRTRMRKSDFAPVWTNVQSHGQANNVQGTSSQQPRRDARPGPLTNAVSVSPSRRRVPLNNYAYFTIRLNSEKEVTTLAVGGAFSGSGIVIEDLKTDFFKSEDIKVLSDHSGGAFDLGFSFFDQPQKSSILAQLKVKFTEKGTYNLTINQVTAYDENRNPIQLQTSSSEVEVF